MPFEPDSVQPSGFQPDQAATATPPQNLTGIPTSAMTSQWEATKYGVGQAAQGAWDTIKGMAQSTVPQSPTDFLIGPGGMAIKSAISGLGQLGQQATQVPGAIKDLYNSQDPLAALAQTAPYAGGQSAAILGTAGIGKGLGSLAAKATAPMTAEDAVGLIRKGVLPKDPDFVPNLQKNLGTIADAEKAGPPVQTKADFAQLLQKTADSHRQAYEALLTPNQDATVSSRMIQGYQGATLGDEGAHATLRQLDQRLSVINNTIRDAKAGVGGAPLGTQGIAPLKAESAAIRNVLDPELQRLTGTNPAPIRATMGQLNDLARQVQASDIARFNQINRPIDAPTTTRSGAVSWAAGKAQRTLMGEPQDAAIRKAFQGLRR